MYYVVRCGKDMVQIWGALPIWCMVPEIWSVMGRIFYFELFLHFYLPDNLKNQNFEKMETPWKYYILYMCTIYKNHMMHGS